MIALLVLTICVAFSARSVLRTINPPPPKEEIFWADAKAAPAVGVVPEDVARQAISMLSLRLLRKVPDFPCLTLVAPR